MITPGAFLSRQFLEEFLLVQPVFESFASVDEDHRDFIRELAPEAIISLNVDFAPAKASPALQFSQRFLHDLAKMTSLSRVHNNVTQIRHGGSLAKS
jgi:hypothetical protein